MSMKTFQRVSAAALIASALTACGGAPKTLAPLDQAQSDYDRASADQTVARHAADELDQARSALDSADRAWNKDEEKAKAEHYARLASQRVAIAELVARSNEANAEIENMKGERQRVQLDLRAQEIELSRQETLAMKQQMKDMQAMQAKETDRGMVLTLGDVLFDSGEATLKAGAARNLQQIGSFLVKHQERVAEIEGHTDSMGDDDFNMDLSRERAFAVRTRLVELGVQPKRITTRGYGEGMPVASNKTPAGRQENRRVEIIFPDTNTQVSELAE